VNDTRESLNDVKKVQDRNEGKGKKVIKKPEAKPEA
jgi:hypothetical protein